MSIQPNRIVNRIIQQVNQSDWPRLTARVFSNPATGEWVRLYREDAHPRYATAIHFWVHALREELEALGRGEDLIGAAGHALCRARTLEDWTNEIETFGVGPEVFRAPVLDRSAIPGRADDPREIQVHRMLESECRRSSVVDARTFFVADFWGHGAGASWRRSA